jgi:hypothetical protein
VNIVQGDIEKVYRLIEQHSNGISLKALAKQYPPKDPIVPYAVAQLAVSGRIETEECGDVVRCFVVGTDAKEREPREEGGISCKHI